MLIQSHEQKKRKKKKRGQRKEREKEREGRRQVNAREINWQGAGCCQKVETSAIRFCKWNPFPSLSAMNTAESTRCQTDKNVGREISPRRCSSRLPRVSPCNSVLCPFSSSGTARSRNRKNDKQRRTVKLHAGAARPCSPNLCQILKRGNRRGRRKWRQGSATVARLRERAWNTTTHTITRSHALCPSGDKVAEGFA